MKKKLVMAILVGLLMIGLPMAHADTEVDVDVLTGDDVDLDITVTGDEINTTIILNGEDVLDAKHQAELAQQATHDLLIRMFMRRDYERRSQDRMDDIEEEYRELLERLNVAFANLWRELSFSFHVLGIDHNSTSIVLGLKSGNVSVADYLFEHEIRLNDTVVTIYRIEDDLQIQINDVASNLEKEIALLVENIKAEAEVKRLSFDAYKFDQHDAMTKMQMEIDDLKEKSESLLYLSMGLAVVLMVLGFHLWTKNAQ